MSPAHFICWNHFCSFLSVQTRVQETRRFGPPESRRTLSRGNHFSSFLPGETCVKGARRSGSPGCTAFFRGNQFSSFLPARTAALEAKRSGSPGCSALFFEGTSFPHSFRLGPQALEAKRSGSPGCSAPFFKGTTFPHSFRLGPQPWKPGDRARRDTLHFVSREPLFLIPFVSRTPLAAPDFSPVVLPLALRRKEIAEFWQYGKRARRCSDSFRQHPDTVLAKVA